MTYTLSANHLPLHALTLTKFITLIHVHSTHTIYISCPMLEEPYPQMPHPLDLVCPLTLQVPSHACSMTCPCSPNNAMSTWPNCHQTWNNPAWLLLKKDTKGSSPLPKLHSNSSTSCPTMTLAMKPTEFTSISSLRLTMNESSHPLGVTMQMKLSSLLEPGQSEIRVSPANLS